MSENILGANNVKTPGEKATLERRQLQLIERRHEMAVVSLRIERILRESTSDEPTNDLSKKIEKELLDIDPSLKVFYLKAVDRFFKRKKRYPRSMTRYLQNTPLDQRPNPSMRNGQEHIIFNMSPVIDHAELFAYKKTMAVSWL